MAEVIEIQSYKYQFITSINRLSLVQLQTWMKTTHMQANGIGTNASIILYYTSDLSVDIIKALKETYMDVIFKEKPANIFSDILGSKSEDKTISIYFPVNSVMSRLPLNMIDKAIKNGAAVLPSSCIGLFSLNSVVGSMALQTIYESDDGQLVGVPDTLYMNDEENVCTVSLEETFKRCKPFYKYAGQFIPTLNSDNLPLIVYVVNANENTSKHILEYDWLNEIFGRKIEIKKMPETSADLKSGEQIWVLASRADLHIWQNIFKSFSAENRNFKVIHCSDEFGKDDISWYTLPNCKAIVRNYYRPECESMTHVVQIPLGYSARTDISDLQEKKYTWSFEGTAWFNRPEKLAILDAVKPNFIKLYPKWNDSTTSSREDYFNKIKESIFVPIIRGNHFETFRLYEAIEAQSIPLIVREQGDDVFWNWLKTHLPLLEIKSYDHATKTMNFLLKNKEHLEKYRNEVYQAYMKWKTDCKNKVRALI